MANKKKVIEFDCPKCGGVLQIDNESLNVVVIGDKSITDIDRESESKNDKKETDNIIDEGSSEKDGNGSIEGNEPEANIEDTDSDKNSGKDNGNDNGGEDQDPFLSDW